MEKSLELATNIYSWLTKDGNFSSIKDLSENQILNIANEINSLFLETNFIDAKPELALPRLVVVGTQSSGKSSVLNAIMGMDVLPTGKDMVTRTPLDLRLHKVNGENGWVEFGDYGSEGWALTDKVSITVPDPETSEINKIRDIIKKKTVQIAGHGKNISHTPIIVQIYSPYVPNLSLTDLPGLTMVACVDKGQPEDIKDRIENLVTSYIKQPRTIILSVMAARSDLETDLGLALIKRYDQGGKRTIGVLTKPDLMNYENHVGDYLTNSISKNLMLTYGYYVVKNRSNAEMKEFGIREGFKKEIEYFQAHHEYTKSTYENKIGMGNLTSSLNKILVESISELIPTVMTEIVALETIVLKKLEVMGQKLPDSTEGKISVLNKYVSNFYYAFLDSVESRGTDLNTGKEIKDSLIFYRDELKTIKPFENKSVYNKGYFQEVISSFEGNHMSFQIPPIQVLEACMVDLKHRPIIRMRGPSLQCIDNICELLINLLRNLSKQDQFSRYPPLSQHIIATVVDDIISECKIDCKNRVKDLFDDEESYIWTDQDKFKKMLSGQNDLDDMLDGYYEAVKEVVSHSVPKIVMSSLVRKMESVLLSYLIQTMVKEDKIILLREDDEIEKQREYYTGLKVRINNIKKTF